MTDPQLAAAALAGCLGTLYCANRVWRIARQIIMGSL